MSVQAADDLGERAAGRPPSADAAHDRGPGRNVAPAPDRDSRPAGQTPTDDRALRIRQAACEASLLAGAAATGYALLLLALRTHGSTRVAGAIVCLLLLAALLAGWRTGAGVALLRGRPAVADAPAGVPPAPAALLALAPAALLALALVPLGADSRLLFLPALLLAIALGAAAGPRLALAAAALLAAALLAPRLTDPGDADGQRLVLAAAGMLAIPPLLAFLLERIATREAPASGVAAPLALGGHRDPGQPPLVGAALAIAAPTRVLALADAGHPAPAPPSSSPSPLTPRQLDAVALCAAGLRHAEIAERMGVSVHQVRRLLGQARERVAARTSRELVAWALTQGIVARTQRAETETRLVGD